MGKEGDGSEEMGRKRGMVGREERREKRKKEIDRGESRVRQAPRVTRHSVSWVGFVLPTPSFTLPHPPPPSWQEGIGRLVYGVTIVGAGVANRFSAISLRLPLK